MSTSRAWEPLILRSMDNSRITLYSDEENVACLLILTLLTLSAPYFFSALLVSNLMLILSGMQDLRHPLPLIIQSIDDIQTNSEFHWLASLVYVQRFWQKSILIAVKLLASVFFNGSLNYNQTRASFILICDSYQKLYEKRDFHNIPSVPCNALDIANNSVRKISTLNVFIR